MHTRSIRLCLALFAFAGSVFAQDAINKPATIRGNDGGRTGPMQSIFVPPKPGAPFSLTLATEWSRPLANGGAYTLVNERKIARDAAGRIYQERWILVPKNGTFKSQMNVFQITDPEMHTWYNCEPATKVCELLMYHLTTEDTYVPPIGTSGPLPNGRGTRQHEDLGQRSIEGVETHGYRETVTLNPGTMGNDTPMVTTREFWYSPELALNLVSIVDSPEAGKQVFTVKNLSATPPEPGLFVVPDDYKIIDQRKTN